MLPYFVYFGILIGVLLCVKFSARAGNRPPGPTPLPLLGNLFQIGFQPHLTFTKWAKQYGSIYGIKLGLNYAVVISDYKLIKELFNDAASSGRMVGNAVMMELTKGPYGIGNSSGKTWESQRNFAVRHLRNLGFAKNSMETMILEEVQIMLDWFRNQEGLPISGTRIFSAPVVNSLWRITTGERFKWEEGGLAFMDTMDEMFKDVMNITINGLLFAPFLRFIAPNLFGWTRYVKSIDATLAYLQESIKRHEESFNPADLRDFLDNYLFKIRTTDDIKSSFYKNTGDANMIATLFDLFSGGTETTSATLSWTLLYLSQNQSIQNRLQIEIDEVINSTVPSLLHKPNMPFCEALISEVLRISSVVPAGAPHAMISDLDFHGYHLPKGASIFANLFAVHRDPEIWGDPEEFRPDRFLNEDGTKFVPNEALIPFSVGKRKCIGETLARNTLFLFVTSIFQQFEILPDPNIEADFEPDYGLVSSPKPFKIVMSSRRK